MNWLNDGMVDHLREVSTLPDLSQTPYRILRPFGSGGMATVYLAIDVARLAGLPRSVIARSRQIMGQLESGSQALGLGSSRQLSLLPAAPPSPVLARLAAIDINRLTPLEALQLLAELTSLA